MKGVLLLAGMGKRLGLLTKTRHKSLLPFLGKPLLSYLMNTLIGCGIREIIPILGYRADEVLSYLQKDYGNNAHFTPVYNSEYATKNNLFSLFCAQGILMNEPFLLCNGDLILHSEIIKNVMEMVDESVIAIDDSKRDCSIDSPGVIIRAGYIYDLGRHIPFEKTKGYAIGVYKFNGALSREFFLETQNYLKHTPHAGFHDPLQGLFHANAIYAQSTCGLPWADIDTQSDMSHVEEVLRDIIKQE